MSQRSKDDWTPARLREFIDALSKAIEARQDPFEFEGKPYSIKHSRYLAELLKAHFSRL